ncbi:hypothetical protein CWC31_16715 [Pseudoalteromonas ruthenica]|uniref:hypothetical protein n=1 Tax=Pseudoalteromonas ruthenica TaxID=151081 RepID=UPI0011087999|nr:hypothetical protein [Pseudoalteromonas ruthenica]TLX49435.1 hypothetical protein CWC31_16715 [Pseudoalteromonas ruthenica]
MKHVSLLVVVLLVGCSPSWSEGPYEIYWIDGVKSLGFNIGDGAYIGRIDEPRVINANEKFISVYACPEGSCAYYYIDLIKDHKFAEPTEFVFGPYTHEAFSGLQQKLSLPELSAE